MSSVFNRELYKYEIGEALIKGFHNNANTRLLKYLPGVFK